MSWSEPEELFRGYDADGQLVVVWKQDSLFHGGPDYMLEASDGAKVRMPRVAAEFIPALRASLQRGVA